MIPGISLNWRLTSLTIWVAALPTALIACALNRKGIMAPMKAATRMAGWEISMANDDSPSWVMASSAYVWNSSWAARSAEPRAKPLVRALVVLPTASRASMVSMPVFSPDISAMPAALSAMGPNPSSAKTIPMTASMPMVASAVP